MGSAHLPSQASSAPWQAVPQALRVVPHSSLHFGLPTGGGPPHFAMQATFCASQAALQAASAALHLGTQASSPVAETGTRVTASPTATRAARARRSVFMERR